VGASGWIYRVPFQTRVADALTALQDRTLASGDFRWDEESRGGRPQSRRSLAEFKAADGFFEWGTHSILDMERVVPGPSSAAGTITPLSSRETRELLGSDYPTWPDFEAAYETSFRSESGEIIGSSRRWTGRCTILYDGYRPCEFVFWGSSGD